MKLILIGCLFLCSCAVGVVDPIDNEEQPAAPINKASPSQPVEPAPKNDCQVFKDAYGNCIATTVICKGKIKSIDISCHTGVDLQPWKNIPDPPPPFRD